MGSAVRCGVGGGSVVVVLGLGAKNELRGWFGLGYGCVVVFMGCIRLLLEL